ncbi:MAG TPA: protein jag [Spirochaetaceae bacterium]|nr:protein jag [Spirochaetaceae bacterium]
MDMEFDGATEKEAVQKAMDELKIQDFEYEIISETKKGLFKRPSVRIRVIREDDPSAFEPVERAMDEESDEEEEEFAASDTGKPENDMERDIISFVDGLSEKMEVKFVSEIVSRGNKGKINVNLKTDEGSFVIGYKGERLDAIQIITSAYVLKRYSDKNIKVVLDVDDYRQERMQKILKDSIAQAKKVKSTGRSVFLDPLNSYERRAVHKAVGDMGGLATESYGNGLLKRIKIFRA